jgi:hypothetical protein
MTEKPILFFAPMVRAVLAGTKTQTRRALRGFCPPNRPEYDSESGRLEWFNGDEVFVGMRCPYGQPGTKLWVREAWRHRAIGEGGHPERGGYVYRATENLDGLAERWKPSIHMPRDASRITLEVTGVRVERLQDISENDAMAEGAEPILVPPDGGSFPHVEGYRALWESLHGAGSWDANPYVWVVEFRRLERAS